jgi:hypothetical protein
MFMFFKHHNTEVKYYIAAPLKKLMETRAACAGSPGRECAAAVAALASAGVIRIHTAVQQRPLHTTMEPTLSGEQVSIMVVRLARGDRFFMNRPK